MATARRWLLSGDVSFATYTPTELYYSSTRLHNIMCMYRTINSIKTYTCAYTHCLYKGSTTFTLACTHG